MAPTGKYYQSNTVGVAVQGNVDFGRIAHVAVRDSDRHCSELWNITTTPSFWCPEIKGLPSKSETGSVIAVRCSGFAQRMGVSDVDDRNDVPTVVYSVPLDESGNGSGTITRPEVGLPHSRSSSSAVGG